MPKTPEEDLSEAIAQQEEDRHKALVKRAKLERRRQPPTAYYGTNSATGQTQVKLQGAEGVLSVQGLSNSQPSMGQYGRGFRVGFDAGNVRKPEIEIFGKKTGEVCVLALQQRSDGIKELWIGGDRAPIKIFETAGILSASLDLISKRDWIVGYKIQINQVYKVGVVRADGENWEIEDLAAKFLIYKGFGFFASTKVFGYRFDKFSNSENLPYPYPDGLKPILGQVVETNCRSYNLFVQQRYCEALTFVGDRSGTQESRFTAIGFDQLQGGFGPELSNYQDFPYQYSGTHELRRISIQTGEWIGQVQGPGNLDPTGSVCSINGEITGTTGTEQRPAYTVREEQTTTTNLQTQTYSFSASDGAISPSVGNHSISQNRIDRSGKQEGGNGTAFIKKIIYGVTCQAWGNAFQLVYTLVSNLVEFWPEIGYPPELINPQKNHSFFNLIKLSSSIEKEYKFNAIEMLNYGESSMSSEYWQSNRVLEKGAFYSKQIYQGNGIFEPSLYGAFPHYQGNFSFIIKNYLNWNDSEFEILDPYTEAHTQWRELSGNIYPVGIKVDYNGNPTQAENNIFLNPSGVKFEARQIKWEPEGNKIKFKVQDGVNQKKSLPMTNLDPTRSTVLDIKCWSA